MDGHYGDPVRRALYTVVRNPDEPCSVMEVCKAVTSGMTVSGRAPALDVVRLILGQLPQLRKDVLDEGIHMFEESYR